MQFGALTQKQRSELLFKQSRMIRKPTFSMFIEGFADVVDYVIGIDVEVSIESIMGRGNLGVGRATITACNERGYLYGDGGSKIPERSKVKIWAGFDELNVPIFSGYIRSVNLKEDSTVAINSKDYMGLFEETEISGSQRPNDNAKLMLESFCNTLLLSSNIANKEELLTVYDRPSFDRMTAKKAIEKICDTAFMSAYFDENGILNLCERESFNPTDWHYTDDNVIICQRLKPTEIINQVTIEYEHGVFHRCVDQVSIDTYGKSERTLINPLFNYDIVSEKLQGLTSEELTGPLTGFKFVSGESSVLIDCVKVKIKQLDASGYLRLSIHEDEAGVPGDQMGLSQLKASANLLDSFTWETFYFVPEVQIEPSKPYWCVINKGSTTGNVYLQISSATCSSLYSRYDGSWHLEDNKQVLHRIYGSKEAKRVAQDIVAFYKVPRERIRIVSPGVPHLQLFDEVYVDLRSMGVQGRYVIEGRRHILNSNGYVTIDTLRRSS